MVDNDNNGDNDNNIPDPNEESNMLKDLLEKFPDEDEDQIWDRYSELRSYSNPKEPVAIRPTKEWYDGLNAKHEFMTASKKYKYPDNVKDIFFRYLISGEGVIPPQEMLLLLHPKIKEVEEKKFKKREQEFMRTVWEDLLYEMPIETIGDFIETMVYYGALDKDVVSKIFTK